MLNRLKTTIITRRFVAQITQSSVTILDNLLSAAAEADSVFRVDDAKVERAGALVHTDTMSIYGVITGAIKILQDGEIPMRNYQKFDLLTISVSTYVKQTCREFVEYV